MLRPSTIPAVVRLRAAETPDRLGFSFLTDGRTAEVHLTFGELERRSRAVAAALHAIGGRGERALLLYPPGLEFLVGFFGCLRAGAIAVPAYPPYQDSHAARLAAIRRDSGATICLTQRSVFDEGRLQALGLVPDGEDGASAPAGALLRPLVSDRVPAEGAETWRDPDVGPDDLAYLQYTSGSTALPRGVALTHRNVLHNAACIESLFAITPETRAVSWLPLFHDMGLIGMVLVPLWSGAMATLMSPVAFLKRPLSWLEAVSRTGAHISGAPDFAYNLCAQRITPEKLATLDLSSWRVAFTGAEAVRAQTLDRFARAFGPAGFRREAFYPCYGLAEASLLVSGGDHRTPPIVRSFSADGLGRGRGEPPATPERSTRRLVSSGRPLASQTLAIVDPATGTRQPDGTIGEIWVAGPSVGQGYWGRPADTAEHFGARLGAEEAGPFLRTGDLGFLDDGELFVVGRSKDVIIVRGRNYYPDDIELTVASSTPAAAPRGVVAFPVEVDDEERLVVCQEVPADTGRAEMERLIATIRESVAHTHELAVHRVLLVRAGGLPKTPSGKVQRGLCRERHARGELPVLADWSAPAGDGREPPDERAADRARPAGRRSALHERYVAWLVGWVARHARLDPQSVDVGESFARYDMGSFDAMRLAGELEDWLGRRLSPVLVYDYPSIEALAGHLAGLDERARATGGATAGARSHEVAVVGLACRMPQAGDPAAFWEALRAGRDCVTGPPESRRPLIGGRRFARLLAASRSGGFLDDVEQFDADFFGVSPREAEQMDPQHRLLLELAWEALESAGCAGRGLRGSRTGVFVGISTNDYHQVLLDGTDGVDAYLGTGNAASIAANRLSYLLDLRGPSLAVDTACSSSLVAVHLAGQSLAAGECDLALAGGVNLVLAPELTIAFAKAGMMSATGRCRTFDAGADGYVRGEGGGFVVLKRRADAERDGDEILAVVLGSAVNQDGRSAGLTAPNGPAQQAVIRAALERAGVGAEALQYVEAHGTGTPLGDPIEVASIVATLGPGRAPDRRCAIGSVKTNVGHLEAAAGVAGLIKTVLALRHAEIPPHVHFTRPNPNIALDGTPFFVPTAPTPWPDAGGGRRVAGVSSFGFGGTNCHLVVAAADGRPTPDGAPEPDAPTADAPTADRPAHLFVLSARSPEALRALAARHAGALAPGAAAPARLADVCFSAATGRSHFEHRLAVPCARTDALRDALAAVARGDGAAPGAIRKGTRPRIAFLFTGQGSQYPGMGRELHATEPIFRRALARCEAILRDELDVPLLAVLYGDAGERLRETAYAQPALCALAHALGELWRSWGVEADAVLGHSVGEYAAAIAAGALTLEDGLRLIARRGALMQALPPGGRMAVLLGDGAAALAAVAEHDAVSVAAHNAPDQIVASGPRDAVAALVAGWQARGNAARWLPGAHAFHSALMEPALDSFEAAARTVPSAPPRLEWVSNLTGDVMRGAPDARYWRRQVREPVQFAAGVRALASRGYRIFVELGPEPVLTALGRRCVGDAHALWVPGLRQGRGDWDQLLDGLGRLYVDGVDVDWAGFDAGRARVRVALPTYPFQRRAHWPVPGEGAVEAPAADGHPLLGRRVSPAGARTVRFECPLSLARVPYLADHRVHGAAVLPAAAIVEMAAAAAAELLGSARWRLEDLVIATPLVVPEGPPRLVSVTLDGEAPDVWSVRLASRGGDDHAAPDETRHATARIRATAADDGARHPSLADARARAGTEVDVGRLYDALGEQGLQYGRAFRSIRQAWCDGREAVGRLALAPEALTAGAGDVLHPALLDGCFQLVAAAVAGGAHAPGTYVPLGLERLELRRPAGAASWGHVSVGPVAGPLAGAITADLTLFDDEGGLVATGSGLSLRRVEALHAAGERASARAALRAAADRPGWHYWEREIDPATLPEGVYRLGEGALVHVAAFAGMARAIAREVLGSDACAVAALQLHTPLLVGRGSRHLVQTSIATDHAGGATVRVHSRPARDHDRDRDAAWTLHATASIAGGRGAAVGGA